MTKQESKWIKFYPSLDLPKERVSIAYDTNDERGVRYAYGYFQFYNGTCGCFWKDGNEQPKVVKAEDIKYWMPVPSLDVQEEPVSEDLEQAIDTYLATYFGGEKEKQDWPFLKKMAIHFANWQKKKDDYAIEIAHMAGEEEGKNIMKQQMMAKAVDGVVKIDAGGYPYIDRTIELYDYDKDIPLAKRGDKYKVILIKEE